MRALLSQLLHDPKYRLAARSIALVLFVGVVIAGSIPGARAEVGVYATGLVLHGITYAFLAMLWFLGSSGTLGARAVKAVLAAALMGACDELVQSYLPYRSGDVRDWLIDVGAASITATVLALCLPQTVLAHRH